MQVFIEALGTRVLQTKFSRMSEAVADAAPALELVASDMMRVEEQIFASQGRRGGGSWALDSYDWLVAKQRLGLDRRINFATHALYESVTQRGAPGQILNITRDLLEFGSDLPYAATTQRNRPIFKFTVYDRARWRNIIRDYMVGAFRA
jgi:hypothetical protein